MKLIFLTLLVVLCTAELYASSVSYNHHRVYKKYLGCYRDNGARMFKRIFNFGDSAGVDHCVNYCKAEGYVYAGLQFAECFCGNKFPKDPYHKVNEDQCNFSCLGARHEKCGGHWANRVFETGNQILVVKQDGSSATIRDEGLHQ